MVADGTNVAWAAALAVPTVVVAILCSILANEITSYGTKAGLWIVKAVVRLLPEHLQDRYREEWTCDVLNRSDNGSHHLSSLVWALGIAVSAIRLSRPHRAIRAWIDAEVRSTGTGPVLPFFAGLALVNELSLQAAGLKLFLVGGGFALSTCFLTACARRWRPSGYVATKGYASAFSASLMIVLSGCTALAAYAMAGGIAGALAADVVSGLIVGWMAWSLLRTPDAILATVTPTVILGVWVDPVLAVTVLAASLLLPTLRVADSVVSRLVSSSP